MLSPLGRLSRQIEAVCNPRAVVFTMLLGIFLGVASAVALATGAHLIAAPAKPQVADPSLMIALMLSTFGGLKFSLAAVVGAARALWIISSQPSQWRPSR